MYATLAAPADPAAKAKVAQTAATNAITLRRVRVFTLECKTVSRP
jgi:hypothetical protein